MPAAFLWLTPFIATLFNFVEGFAVLATLFQWLRCFNGYAVSMAAPFQWLRRLNGFAVSSFAVSVASPFLWLKPFYASLFEWLTPFSATLF
ncbi:MAG: hypothetical protein II037_10635 [Bacteroidales bacterium]|nr:hypothetical protein [Bacteroidales bacterium]